MSYSLRVGGVNVGQIVTDEEGWGQLELATHPDGDALPLPPAFPNVVNGTEIEVVGVAEGVFIAEAGDPDPASETFQISFHSELKGEGEAKGEVEFQLEQEDFGQQVEFELEVEHLAASTMFAVSIDGISVGAVTTNGLGYGRLRLSSQPSEPDHLLVPADFPPLGENSEIIVGDVLSGHFGQTGSESRPVETSTELHLVGWFAVTRWHTEKLSTNTRWKELTRTRCSRWK